MNGSNAANSSARSSSTMPPFEATVVLLDVPGLRARDPLGLLDQDCGRAGLIFSPGELNAREKRVWNEALQGGWFCYRREGCASGHAIASLAFTLPREGEAVLVLSDDALLLQVVGPRVRVRMPSMRRNYGPEEVKKDFGVEPWQIPDLFSLIGHKPAAVPGCPGLPPALARKLLSHFAGVHELLARPDLLEVYALKNPAALRKLLEKQSERIRAAHARLLLDTGAELPVTRRALERKKYAMLI
jgi:hypothetical protein